MESLTTNTNIEPENEITEISEPEIEPEHETFITITMHFELITTGNIEHEETQSDLVHHEEVLQIESDNEQEDIATNDQESEFNLEESQSDLVHHDEVLQVDSEDDQEIAIKPETQSDNETVINSRKEEVIKEESSEMNVFPLDILSLEKEMEIFFKKPFAVSETIQEDNIIQENNTVNEFMKDNLDKKDVKGSSTKTSSSTRRKRNKIEFDSEDGTSTETSYEYSDYYSYLQGIRSTNNSRRPNAAAPPSQQQEGFFTRMRRFFCC